MEALINNIVNATGWSIFHSLWQGALFYGILSVLLWATPKHQARLRHNMAYLTIVLIFAGFCTSFFALFNWPALTPGPDTLPLTKVINSGLGYHAERYFPVLVSIYGVGLLFQLLILSRGYYQTLQLKNAAKIQIPESWNLVFQSIMRQIGINRKVGFYLSKDVTVPLVLGFFKPVILFPVAFVNQLELVHVEAILIHELGHIRRNDYLLNILKTVMETMLFFNPFTWLCSNHILREREHACDDLVLKQTATPLTYAHALLQIELLKEKQTPAFSMAANGQQQHLYERIKRITDMKPRYNTTRQQVLAVAMTVVTVASLAWVSPMQAAKTSVPKRGALTKQTAVEEEVFTETTSFLQDTIKRKKTTIVQKNTTNQVKFPPPIVTPDPPKAKSNNDVRFPPPIVTPDPPKAPRVKPMQSSPPPPPPTPMPRPPAPPKGQMTEAESNRFAAEMERFSADIERQVNSPEFRKQIEAVERSARELTAKMNSPEWKKQMAELQKHSVEMAQKFSSPEWKKKMEDLQTRALKEAEAVQQRMEKRNDYR